MSMQRLIKSSSQAGAQGFAGILITAGRDQPVDQIGLRVCKNDISRGHEAVSSLNSLTIYANGLWSSIAIIAVGVAILGAILITTHRPEDRIDRV